jgi:hypothetical protein
LWKYPIEWMDHILFLHSSVYGQRIAYTFWLLWIILLWNVGVLLLSNFSSLWQNTYESQDKEENLFWVIVLEVSVHSQLAPLF